MHHTLRGLVCHSRSRNANIHWELSGTDNNQTGVGFICQLLSAIDFLCRHFAAFTDCGDDRDLEPLSRAAKFFTVEQNRSVRLNCQNTTAR